MGNFLRRLVLPKPVKKWSLRTLLEKLIKIGVKVVVCPNSMRKQVFDASGGPFWHFMQYGYVEPAEKLLNLK
jgi:hypothetical protein